MDEGILKVIRDWLKPLPDGSLPNQKLRTELFRTLNSVIFLFLFIQLIQLPVTQDYLEESGGLGKILTLLAKHPLETEANRKFLKELITVYAAFMILIVIFRNGAALFLKRLQITGIWQYLNRKKQKIFEIERNLLSILDFIW